MRTTIIGLLCLLICSSAALCANPDPEKNEQQADVLPCTLPSNRYYQSEKDEIYHLIEHQVHYLRGLIKPWKDDASMKLITKSKSGENEIRPNATCVADLAFLYRFGSFNAEIIGINKQDMLEREIVPMLRYLIRTHKTGDLKTDDEKKWGSAWQSAHWTAAFGNAVWWSWEKLPNEIKEGARRVVAYEADRIAATVPPHQFQKDTKSEENSWNSQVLSSAVILMPNDARHNKWEKALQQWAMSAYLRPADANISTIVDNMPVSKQYNGANIYDDFTLENHDRVHPDYMGAWIMNAGNDLDYLMTGRKPYASFLYNLASIYNNQKRLFLPDGGYGYPNGEDWALFRNPDWIVVNATALVRFNDPGALYYLRRGLETTQKMQQRNSDGAIYAPGENSRPSAQPHVGYWLTQAWLVLQFARQELSPAIPKVGVNYFKDGKFIINRTDNTYHSVAWGEKIMIQLMNLGNDHVISPDERNGIGSIKVNDTIQSVKLISADVQAHQDNFTVHMVIQHGPYVKATIICTSAKDGKLYISETLTALKNCTTDNIATLSFGILNNPNWVYETGFRTIKIGDEKYTVKSGSGMTFDSRTKMAQVDNLKFRLQVPANIVYKTATKMDRSRFTDLLILNAIPEKRTWEEGALISQSKLSISVN